MLQCGPYQAQKTEEASTDQIARYRSRVISSQVEVSTLDVADMEEAKGIVSLAEKQAPVGGIYHLAMILQDRWMANQVTCNFSKTCCNAHCVLLKWAASHLNAFFVLHGLSGADSGRLHTFDHGIANIERYQ